VTVAYIRTHTEYARIVTDLMAYIDVPDGLPGILGPMAQYPEASKRLRALAQELLRGDSPLSEGERELIAAFTSHENDCYFCSHSHGATARHLLGQDADLVDQVWDDLEAADVSPKMRALLRISEKVARSGREVSEEDVERARRAGADDRSIHDTVLITAAFCMYNRYVDGLGTWAPEDDAVYEEHGRELATEGYVQQ
jgi:uncharacterized peroxidase-related enzyme